MDWLSPHFQKLTLNEDHEGYFLGRGAQESSLVRLSVKSWQALDEPAPLEDFRKRYGAFGEKLIGWVLWPLLSPRGSLLGFAGRKHGEKTITRYLLPEGAWNPLWTGLTPDAMQRIYDGGDVWIVEGIFDLFPLEWALPSTDVVLGSERAHLTSKHIDFLHRFCTGWVRMAYDNDPTGQKALYGWVDETGKKRWGALDRLQRVGVRATVVDYQGEDPGKVWDNGGSVAVQSAFNI